MIVNYDHKTFIVQATGPTVYEGEIKFNNNYSSSLWGQDTLISSTLEKELMEWLCKYPLQGAG